MMSKWLQSELFNKSYNKVRDLMPLKGIVVYGGGITLYRDFFRDEFGIEPLNIYGTTEFGLPMVGAPDRKTDLMPNIRDSYYEFIEPDGEIKKIDELKRGGTYELAGTPFGSIIFRYRIGDVLTVVDFRDDGLPLFAFVGRVENALNFYTYYNVTEGVISKVLVEIGLKSFEKWALTNKTQPMEHLHIIMEKPWEYSEEETSKLIFESMQKTTPDFQNFVKDFKIRKPSQVIKVEYLKRGAFLRYTIKKSREGVPFGQIKPPKIIPPDKREIFELLRQI